MKQKKVFFAGMILATLFLTGCDNGTTDSSDNRSKKTTIDEIVLTALHYPPEAITYWESGWESSFQDNPLKLSNLLPNGEIKNNTTYEVAINGTLEFASNYVSMDKFQFVFTVPGVDYFSRWTDLVNKPYPPTTDDCKPYTTGSFYIKGTLTTNPDAENNFDVGSLALTNAVPVAETEDGVHPATLTNVTITITEK